MRARRTKRATARGEIAVHGVRDARARDDEKRDDEKRDETTRRRREGRRRTSRGKSARRSWRDDTRGSAWWRRRWRDGRRRRRLGRGRTARARRDAGKRASLEKLAAPRTALWERSASAKKAKDEAVFAENCTFAPKVGRGPKTPSTKPAAERLYEYAEKRLETRERVQARVVEEEMELLTFKPTVKRQGERWDSRQSRQDAAVAPARRRRAARQRKRENRGSFKGGRRTRQGAHVQAQRSIRRV